MLSHIEKMIERNRAVRDGNTPYEDKEWLRTRYEDKLMSLRDIAKEAECGLRTIARWVEIHGIETRKGSTCYVKDRSGANHPNWQNNLTYRKTFCACGNRKTVKSKRCQPCFFKANSGEGNSGYKGIADVMMTVRGYAAFNWRPLVYARDAYTCQHCGDSKGGNLHAHHIKPLSEIVRNKFKQMNLGVNSPEKRLAIIAVICADSEVNDINNGVTLCEDCHKQEHKKVKYKHALPRNYLKKTKGEIDVSV